MSPNANKVRTRALAEELGVSIDTIARWARTDKTLAACRWRRGWWDVTALRAGGYLQAVANA